MDTESLYTVSKILVQAKNYTLDIFKTIFEQPNISSEFIEAIINAAKVKSFPKGEILLMEGTICRTLYFIEKGALRFYYIDEDGNDITHWFSFEGSFMTEVDSFFSQLPSDFYLETLEDSELVTFSLDSFETLSNQFPEFTTIEKIIYRKSLVELGEKIKDLQFRNAKIRYENLIKKQEDILQRVALGHIASYLGITQQSLSRIRRERSNT